LDFSSLIVAVVAIVVEGEKEEKDYENAPDYPGISPRNKSTS
jgi:hypothetical protein